MSYFDNGNLKNNSKNMSINNKIDWWNQMMNTFQHIHNQGIVHRDLKPDHFMKQNNKWYILDFGLSNTFLDSDNNHIDNSIKHDIVGTPKYTSINVHNGDECVCRDDFISLLYIFIDLLYDDFINYDTLNKNLVTNDISINSYFNQWLKQQKQWQKINDFQYENKYIQNIFKSLLHEARNLEFTDKPNYTILITTPHK
jgi:serine/threonine protein kinase